MSDPYYGTRHQNYMDYMADCYPGIVLGGAIYPLLLVSLSALAAVVTGHFPPLTQWPVTIIAMVIGIVLGALCGTFVAAICGLFTTILILTINSTLGNAFSRRNCAIAAGGLAGFIPTGWMILRTTNSSASDYAIAVCAGPIGATLVGAVSVHWYAQRRVDFLRSIESSIAPAQLRFRIRHLIVATTWMAVLFGLSNAISGGRFVVLFALWLGGQTLVNLTLHIVSEGSQRGSARATKPG